MAQSKIEWTEVSWNPVTGCTKISSGCKNCYAEAMARRLKAMGQEKYINGFKLTLHPETLNEPYTWKKSKIVFVNSMSDLFHEAIPLEYIQKVFTVMNNNRQHIFQVLTKRAEILYEYNEFLSWTPNIWMGVTVEDESVVNRLEYLKQTNAHIKFISFEPLLSKISNLSLQGIDWSIVGGESGRTPLPMKEEWVLEIKRQCEIFNVPFFFKQWGGFNKKKNGRTLEGKTYDEMPDVKEAFEYAE